MAITRIPNIDENGNFTNPEVLDRLRGALGGSSAVNVDAHTISANMPDGVPDAMSETGQPVSTFGNGSAFTVTGGVITNTHTASSNGSAYLQTRIAGDDPVRRMFAVVNQQPTGGSSLALVLPATEWRAGGTGPLGPAGIHYVINPDGVWHVGYWAGSAEETYVSGTSGAWHDGTDRYVEITVDPVASSATVLHPDGSSSTFSDPRIAANISGWGIIESYVFSGTAESFAVKEFGLAMRGPSAAEPFVSRQALSESMSGVRATAMSATTAVTSVAGTGATETSPGVTQVSFVAPPSGQAIVTVEAFVQITDPAAHYIWGLADAAGHTTSPAGKSLRRVYIGTYNGILMARFVLTGMTPGARAAVSLRHMSTVANVATLRVGGANAYPFTMTVQPLG